MVPCTACGAVLTRLNTVGEPTAETFGKTKLRAGRANSPPSTKLRPESKDKKNPVTADVEADISTQPVWPLMPSPNNSDARFAIWPDAGTVNDTGFVIRSARMTAP